jgi:hypothetical protein
MSISADQLPVQNGGMNKPMTTAVAPATGRGTVTRISDARQSPRTRNDVSRAREARRDLRARSERFAHLKQMHD